MVLTVLNQYEHLKIKYFFNDLFIQQQQQQHAQFHIQK